jgi:cytoskeletal protein RodZ
MSDDTPTQRFPSPDGDAPTQRLEAMSEELVDEKKKSNVLLIVLIILGVLLVAGIIAALVLLLGRGQGNPQTVGDTTTPSASPSVSTSATPSEAPSATPTPTPSQTQDAPPPPPPPSNTLKIDSFTASPKTVFCNTQAPNPTNQYLTFAWKTSNADTVTIFAQDSYGDFSGMYYNLPSDGNSNDSIGSGMITYFCPQATQIWRLEAKGNGHTVTQDIKIKNTGDTQ